MHYGLSPFAKELCVQDASSPRSSDFEIELASYLTELKLDRATSQHALGLLQGHDFSSARAALVASTPGRHKGVLHKGAGTDVLWLDIQLAAGIFTPPLRACCVLIRS